MNLVEHSIQISKEIPLLMRIFSIAQNLTLTYSTTEGTSFFSIEIIENGRIIIRAYPESFLSQPSTFCQRSTCSMLHQHIEQRLVLLFTGYDSHILKILCSSTNQANATYINFFNDICFRSTTSHRFFERIEIHNDQINLRNFIFLHLLLVLLYVTTSQDSTKHLRMQSLHSTT